MTWIKSSACNGAASCVEVAWVRASRCDTGNCVEVHLHADAEQVWVRDSKLGDASPVVRFSVGEWWSYVAASKSRHLYAGPVVVAGAFDSWHVWHRDVPGVVLDFDGGEVVAFAGGVVNGDFDPTALSAGDGSDGDGRVRSCEAPVAAVGPSQVSA